MKTKLIALSLLSLLIFAACGGGGSARDAGSTDGSSSAEGSISSEGGNSGATEVAIATFNFQPKDLEVKVGETVTWTNEDDILHTVTSGKQREQAVPGGGDDDVEAEADGTFDGDLDGAGTTFSFTFEEAGEYPYFCEVHVAMTGTVVVSE